MTMQGSALKAQADESDVLRIDWDQSGGSDQPAPRRAPSKKPPKGGFFVAAA